MKSKKLISFLCAAALTASSFAALTINASAATEDDILWSDTFDNAATGVFLDGTTIVPGTQSSFNSDAISGLTFATGGRANGDRGSYTANDGTYIYNGSYYAVYESDDDATDKYLRLSVPVFGDYTANGRWGYVTLGESGYAATADTDVVMDFDMKLENGLDAGVVSTTDTDVPVLRIGSFDADARTATAVEIDKSALSIGDDWVHARIVVSATDGAKLYIEGVEQTSAANASVTTLATIGLYNQNTASTGSAMLDLVGNNDYDKDGTLGDPDALTLTPNIDLDNVIIYSETAGVATGTSDAPGAQSQDAGATIAPVATAVPIGTAPVLVAPESADEDTLSSFTFDSDKVTKWSLGTSEQTVTAIDGLSIAIGGRSGGGNVDTYAAVVAADSGNVLRLQAGPYAHAGRGPVLSFNESMPISYEDGTATALSFAVKLSVPEGYEDSETAAPRLYFLKSNSQAGDDNAGAYNQVAAVLTTVADETIYRGETDVISTYITPDEWHYVTFVVTPDSASGATQRLYVDGAEEASVKCSYVGTGETATYMDDLPLLAVESKAAKIDGSDVAPDYSLATIDNILIYQGQPSEPRRMVATVSEVEATEAPEVTEAPATPEPVATVAMTVTENDDNTATVSMTSDMDTDAVLIQAEYTESGALNGVKVLKELTLTEGVAAAETLTDLVQNDKIMLWNSLKKMQPLADAYTVKGGAAQATDAPAPTEEPTEAPSTEETTAPSTEETTEPTTEPTTTPTEEPTTTYTVTGTVDEGVASVALTPAEGDAIDGVIDGTTVTFTGVEAGTYTVTVTAADGYKNPTSTPAEITVSADASAAFTATATKIVTSAITIAADTGATVTVTAGTTEIESGDTVAEDETVTIAASADLGYILGDITVTKTASGDAVTVTDNAFTMPAEAVTITVKATQDTTIAVIKPTVATYVVKDDDITHATDELLKINGTMSTSSETETMLLAYDASAYAGKYVDANIVMTLASGSYSDKDSRWADTAINYGVLTDAITAETVWSTYTAPTAIVATDTWTGTKDASTASTEDHGVFAEMTVPVNDDAVLNDADGMIYLAVGTSTARLHYVKNDSDSVPTLVLTLGTVITFKVTDSEETPTAIAGATIELSQNGEVVKTLTTSDDGTISSALTAGEYTYTVTKEGYTILKDQSLNVTDTDADEEIKLEVSKDNTVTVNVYSYADTEQATPLTLTTDYTIAVYTAETKSDGELVTADEGGTYTLTQGNTYYYTVTPVSTDYDTLTGSYEVPAETASTLKLTLPQKTYAATIQFPQYATITLSGTGLDETVTATTNSGATGLVSLGNLPANTVVSYTMTKGGYTEITSGSATVTADNYTFTAGTPTTTGTLLYEDFATAVDSTIHAFGFDTTLGGSTPAAVETTISNGTLKCYINGNGGRSIYAALNGVTGYTKYEIKYTFGSVGAGQNKNADQTNTFSFLDSNGVEIFGTYFVQNNGTVNDYGYTVNGTSTSLGTALTGTAAVDVIVDVTAGTVTGTVNGESVSADLNANTVATISKMYISGNKYSIWYMDDFEIIGLTE